MNSEKFYNNYLVNSYSSILQNQDEERQYHDYFVKNFKKFLPLSKDSEILDIGVGNGRTLRTLKRLGYKNASGIDIAKELVNEAKKSGLNCDHVEDTLSFLRNKRKRYDFIYLSHVIEHISKSEAPEFMAEIKNALADGGVLVIVTPSVQNIFYVGPFWDFTHVNFFTERSIYQLCEVAGFTKIMVSGERIPLNIYGKGAISFVRFFFSDLLIRVMRTIVEISIRVVRFLIGTINPKILSFNLICICKKND